ncbi:MAG: Gfo/Idh/MocA family oxidoreductase [Candidatus Krumholzibacteriia bacterium]
MGIRVGVVGTGRLGTQHVRVLKRLPEVDDVACYDIVEERSRDAGRRFGATVFTDMNEMLGQVDAVSVVVPTVKHKEVSLKALEKGTHLFVEKPIAASMSEAGQIIEAASRRERVLQIGHIERFNAALRKAYPHIEEPSFIEIHRLAPFTVRGIDVSVIMDLMIHDLDLLGLFLGEAPADIRAKGAGILTDRPDIVNARLEYRNGCVANLTASRVSMEPMRKIRIFSRRNYLSIDLLKGTVKHLQKGDAFDAGVARIKRNDTDLGSVSLRDFLKIEESAIEGEEPLFDELQSFCQTIMNGRQPPVTGEDGLRALEIATAVQRIVSEKPIR